MHCRAISILRRIILAAALACLTSGLRAAQPQAPDWPHWRGPHDNGSAAPGAYPTTWDPEHVLWKVTLPGKGCSTPIVSGGRIYVTAPVHAQDALLAFDWNGEPLWQTIVGPERRGKSQYGSGCNPSPTTDGQAIYVYYKSGDLACINLDGAIAWKTNLQRRFGGDNLYWDVGTSPVLTAKSVVIAMIRHGESYIAAFDKRSGDMQWRTTARYVTPDEGDHSYATPLLITRGGRESLLMLGGERLTAYDAADGHITWWAGDFNPQKTRNWVPVASPVIAGDIAVVPYGRGTRLHGIHIGGEGDLTATARLWVREGVGSFVPTPAEHAGRIYVLGDRGQVDCIDPATGKTIWSDALPRSGSNYYASPTIADGKLYAARQDGVVFVAQIEGGFKLLSKNEMHERMIASPVAIGNRILLRGEEHLFCAGGR